MKFVHISGASDKKIVVDSLGDHVLYLFNYSGHLDVQITSSAARVYIYGIYVGRGNDEFKLFTTQHHMKGDNMSDLLVRGVFFDNSRFKYEGLIRIDKNAQKSNAYQKNQNILMSNGAFVDSRPFLEILANDVRCTHGSTTGKIDEEMLYYLQSRAISKKKSERLILEGFIGSIFSTISGKGVTDNVASLQNECFSYLHYE